MFYESNHSLHSDLLKIESGTDFSFPAHLHSSFELIAVTDGEMRVVIDKKQYMLTPGKAVLVFPNQVHSLETPKHSCHSLWIFSTQLVHSYNYVFLNKLPVSNLFTPSIFHLRELLQLRQGDHVLRIKGLLYLMCGEFDESVEYEKRDNTNSDLIQRIFDYVETHYREECSLKSLAAHTSYHSVYLSRFFKEYTGVCFLDYVNRYRIHEAAYSLKNTQQKIEGVAFDCGFTSIRSFHRNFREIMGITPREYREQNKDADSEA